MDRVIIILGGRMAEEHFFGKVTTGAADDLQKVYELTRAMVTQFGMSEVIGNIGFEEENYINKYS
jgi:ATP-dependent Zn protease